MTRAQIEVRIQFVQDRLAEARHPENLKQLNGLLEKLIMMEADDDNKTNH